MPKTKRKKLLTELEKLQIKNCISRRSVASHHVTPDKDSNKTAGENEPNFSEPSFSNNIHLGSKLEDILDDNSSSSSYNSSFELDDTMASDVDDEIIKELPKDGIQDMGGTPDEQSKDAIFPAEVIEKLQHTERIDVSIDNEDIWMEEDINKSCQLVSEDPQLRDVPSVLVEDDDSVLFPCNGTKQDVLNESNKTKYEIEMEKIRNKNKAHVRLCKTLLGNGIIDLLQLETKISSNLLCLQCVMEEMYDPDSNKGYMIDECGVIVGTIHHGFACTVMVECVWRHHMFSIEPERVQQQSCINKDTKETTMLENEIPLITFNMMYEKTLFQTLL